jgi:hypothetical protein
MAHTGKSPAAGGAANRAKDNDATSSESAPYHTTIKPDHYAGWESYRDAQDAERARKVALEEKLRAAAGLYLNRDEYSRFWLKCPHCGGAVAFYITKGDGFRAGKFGVGPTCAAIPSIQRWCDAGFANGGRHPDKESIWDECRKEQEAKASDAAWLKAKAAELGFTWSAYRDWARKCECGGEWVLFIEKDSERLCVQEWNPGPTCSASNRQWLRDAGFTFEDGAA